MPLPDAKPDKRIYELLKTVDLENLTFDDLQAVGQTIFAEQGAEDELRRLVLLNLARLSTVGEWVGLTTAGGGSYVALSEINPTLNSVTYPQVNLMQQPYGNFTNDEADGSFSSTRAYYVPFSLPSDQTVDSLIMHLATASTTASVNLEIGVYDTDANGWPSTQLFKSTFDVGSGAATGNKIVSVTTTGGTAALTGGTTYYLGVGYTVDPLSQWASVTRMADNIGGGIGGIFANFDSMSDSVMNANAIRDNTSTQFTLPSSLTVTPGTNWQPLKIDTIAMGCIFA